VIEPNTPYWSSPLGDLLADLNTSDAGLSGEEATRRLAQVGPNTLKTKKKTGSLGLLLGQFKSPIILILIAAAFLSLFLRDPADALIILSIVLVSGLLGFWQEHGAAGAVDKLLQMVEVRARVLRDGNPVDIPVEAIVPGDVVLLSAGASLPGDCRLLASKDLFLNEAALTGETYPVEKIPGTLPADTPLAKRENILFMGTHVVSGSGQALVVQAARNTELGKVSDRLKLRPPETDFEHGIRRFGYFLMSVTLILVILIFAVNVYLKRPVMDSFMFSLALAVGLAPQLLPAIISVNLSHGARRMAEKQVIVKRLESIENFGSMDVLCSDKTGTLTEGTVRVHSTPGLEQPDEVMVLRLAYLNACFQTGFSNPIDEAIKTHRPFDVSGVAPLDEIPYDFIRKRLTVLVEDGDQCLMITKGAFANVLEVCSQAEDEAGQSIALDTVRQEIQERYETYSAQGLRTLGIAYRKFDGPVTHVTRDDEAQMVFRGFLLVYDPPKADIVEIIQSLNALGVSLKIITGDNRLVAAYVGRQVGLPDPQILAGPQIRQMSDEALRARAGEIDLFAEVEPNQKERIILALKKAGYVVGYMGDGINDASALHAADVGISVESAVDVAKESADIVLLAQDLAVLVNGVREGRMTFANTLKYVFMATSANFGNMFSMAGASLLLPFLPLLPKQILLTNLLTDFPEMTIASDSVDDEWVTQPRRWNLRFIRNFMLTFGTVSSLFDYLTFGVLLFLLHADPDQFRTGWFAESVISAALIVLVIRTRRPFFRSKPGRGLLIATLTIVAAVLVLPLTPLGPVFGFKVLPLAFWGWLVGIVVLYIAAAEIAKIIFYKRVQF